MNQPHYFQTCMPPTQLSLSISFSPPVGSAWKIVMTHARQRNSLCRYRSESKEQVSCQIHAETMGRTWPECPAVEKKTKRHSYKRRRDKEIKQHSADSDRKLYPLRGRQGMNDVGSLNCRVLLTRLEEGGTCKGSMKAVHKNKRKRNMKVKKGRTKSCKCRKKGCKACQPMPGPKSNPKPDKTALYMEILEPRKRRLASLNAEAVNSLLLFREDSQMSKKQQNSQKGDGELPKGEIDSSRKGLESQKRTHPAEREGTKRKKSKNTKARSEHLDQLNLNSPTPRRLAGLNAAALLKLTSTSSGAKRRAKTDTKPGSGGVRSKQLQGKMKKQPSSPCPSKPPVSQQCCNLCKKEALKTDTLWEGTSGGHDFIKPGYQCRSMLGYSLKPVKEEKTETDVNSCYCCSQERSVEYCHRLALFLGQKAYPDSEQHSLPSVKGFLPPPHTLTHPALTLGAHSYPCYPGYYVHISHHGTSSHPVSTSPGPHAPPSVPPITLCPTGVQRPKLLSSPVSHPSGIPHPVYCNSVGTCYGEPCRISGCAYRHTQPIANRGCSFSAGCSSCGHKIKMGKTRQM